MKRINFKMDDKEHADLRKTLFPRTLQELLTELVRAWMKKQAAKR